MLGTHIRVSDELTVGFIILTDMHRLRQVGSILERHLQRQRQAIKFLSNGLAGKGKVCPSGSVPWITILGLELGACSGEGSTKVILKRF